VWQLNCRHLNKILTESDEGRTRRIKQGLAQELASRRIHDLKGFYELVAALQDLGYIAEMSTRGVVMLGDDQEESNHEVGTLITYNPVYADTKRLGTLDGTAHGHNWCSIQLRAGTGPRLVVISAYARSTRQGTREEGEDISHYSFKDCIIIISD
jgi:hypothetical protein